MKITTMDIWTVVVPTIPGRVHSLEFGPAGWDEVPKHIIRLHTDEGIYGLGETPRGCGIEQVQEGFQILQGRDPLQLSLQHIFTDAAPHRAPSQGTRNWENLSGWPSGPAYEAFEMAVYDIVGNLWEWTGDCWNESYAGAPDDGAAWTSGNCGARVLRGGSWGSVPGRVRSAFRVRGLTGSRGISYGFRVARTLSR